MRTKQTTVCHTCRRHKIGCDGRRPNCTQCKLMGRDCGGYVQELLIIQHKPSSRQRKCTFQNRTERRSTTDPDASLLSSNSSLLWPTYKESVAVVVQRYIPSHEIPFLSPVSPSRSRICGGWVQALPYVDQTNAGFEQVLLPSVRALVMSMMITSTESRRHYLNIYGDALHGIGARMNKDNNSVDSAVSLASMCLTLSEVMMPTSSDGWMVHIKGVAAMMQSRGPLDFKDGIPHLLFVGFRPLIVLESLIKRRTTFLMDKRWRTIPFSTQRPSPMQVLLGHAAVVPSLLERANHHINDNQILHRSLQVALETLEKWENDFVLCDETNCWLVPSCELDSSIGLGLLPETCFNFLDVSHANSLTHCWAFRIVCLLQLCKLGCQEHEGAISDEKQDIEEGRKADILILCTQICQGLPYLLQNDMSLYGPLSAAFPLRMVLESLNTLQLTESDHVGWCKAIKMQLLSKGISSI